MVFYYQIGWEYRNFKAKFEISAIERPGTSREKAQKLLRFEDSNFFLTLTFVRGVELPMQFTPSGC